MRIYNYMPARHRTFLERALAAVPGVDGIVGLAAGGSFIAGEIDEFSDLDLVLAVDPGVWPEILDRQQAVAAELAPSFLAGFTGEHVGEPRLLVCLYGPPLLHVDLKFVSLDDAHERVEDPVILWERDGLLSAAFARAEPRYPRPRIRSGSRSASGSGRTTSPTRSSAERCSRRWTH